MTEKILQRTLIKQLEYLQAMGRLVFIRVNSGVVFSEYKGARHMIRMASPGTSDLILFGPDGRVVFLELKGDKGRQSPAQKAFQASVERLKYRYVLAKDHATAWAAIEWAMCGH